MLKSQQNDSYIAYIRKSTDDKENQVLSLETQSDIIKRLELKHNIHISQVISEKKSAKRPGREGFNSMIKLIRERKAQGIVVWSAHRLSRNAQDTAKLITLFDERLLKEIITESSVFKNTPMDVFMLGFYCAQAKLENDNKAIDVKSGMEKCASIGIYPGKPPLGYLTDPHGIKGNRKRDIDTVRFPLIRKIWDEMLTGKSSPKLVWKKVNNEWNLRSRNGFRLSLGSIYKILHNPFYYGEFLWPKRNGKMYKGKHKPMITRDEFEAVQSMLNKKSQPRPISRYFTYGSCTFHCGECGGAISGYNRIKKQKNGNIHSYIYYQCSRNNSNCSQTNIKEEHIESQVINILKSITFPERLFSLVIEGNVIDIDQELKEYESKMANTKLAYQNAKKKIDGLIDLRSRDQISEEQFIRIKSQTETELNRLNEQLENKSYNIIDWNTFLNKALLFGSLALNKFTEGTPEQKRNILSNLSSNLTITDKNIDIQRIKWYLPFKSLSKSINEINDKIEPPTTLKNNDKIEFSKNYSLVCSLVKDVKTTIYNNPQREWFPIVDEWNKAQKAIPP